MPNLVLLDDGKKLESFRVGRKNLLLRNEPVLAYVWHTFLSKRFVGSA